MAQRTRRYLIRRAVVVLLTLFVVTLLSFLLMRLSPIDPATAYVKRNSAVVTQEQIDEARCHAGPGQAAAGAVFRLGGGRAPHGLWYFTGDRKPGDGGIGENGAGYPDGGGVFRRNHVPWGSGSGDAGVSLATEGRKHDSLIPDHDRHFRARLLSGAPLSSTCLRCDWAGSACRGTAALPATFRWLSACRSWVSASMGRCWRPLWNEKWSRTMPCTYGAAD